MVVKGDTRSLDYSSYELKRHGRPCELSERSAYGFFYCLGRVSSV